MAMKRSRNAKPSSERNERTRRMSDEFGFELYSKAYLAATNRRAIEDRWYIDILQYYGNYDPKTAESLDQQRNRSKLFVNLTRAKCRVLIARLIDTLLPQDESNWDVENTPKVRLMKALEEVENLDGRQLQQQETEIAKLEIEHARKAVKGMRQTMMDQLVECMYYDVCRSVITQGVRLGSGVTKGPYKSPEFVKKWSKKGDGKWSMERAPDMMVPKYGFVNLWYFYPDMDAASMKDAENCFELHRWAPRELRRHALDGTLDKEASEYLLSQGPTYMPSEPGDFNQNLRYVRLLEHQQKNAEPNRFLIMEYTGPLPYDTFEGLCRNFDRMDRIEIFQEKDNPLQTVIGKVWFCAGKILKFDVVPYEADNLGYSVFSLDPTEGSVIGSPGVPAMLRDPQSSLNAAWRGAYDSAGQAGLPMYVVDRTRVQPHDGKWEVSPGKLWESKGGFSTQEGGDPIRTVSIDGNPTHFIELIKLSLQFMDDETNMSPLAQGDPGTGARQTAHGLTLLANNINVLFRDAARSFDADITIPNMTALYDWNMLFSKDKSIKGDMKCKARGSSVLMINELVGQNMLMLINMWASNPEVFSFLRPENMVRVFLRTQRLDKYNIMMTEEEIKELMEEAKNAPPPPDPQVEGKKELAQMDHGFKMEQLTFSRETELVKASMSGELTHEQIMAGLEKAKLQGADKVRLFLAEASLKKEHGTGL